MPHNMDKEESGEHDKFDTSYGALLVLIASFSLKIGIVLRDSNVFTVSESCSLKSVFLKSLSVTRS